MLEGLFIQKVLREEGQSINRAIKQNMVGFSTETKSGRTFNVDGTTLVYTHKARHRFIDMRTRNTKKGKIKKKNHIIHNRPLFGHIGNLISRLSYGFTDAAKNELLKLHNQKI